MSEKEAFSENLLWTRNGKRVFIGRPLKCAEATSFNCCEPRRTYRHRQGDADTHTHRHRRTPAKSSNNTCLKHGGLMWPIWSIFLPPPRRAQTRTDAHRPFLTPSWAHVVPRLLSLVAACSCLPRRQARQELAHASAVLHLLRTCQAALTRCVQLLLRVYL